MPDKDAPERPDASNIVQFPQSRIAPQASEDGFKDLGLSDLARRLGAPSRQGTGHWCSRCQGIWYGYLLEVACPKCGGRNG